VTEPYAQSWWIFKFPSYDLPRTRCLGRAKVLTVAQVSSNLHKSTACASLDEDASSVASVAAILKGYQNRNLQWRPHTWIRLPQNRSIPHNVRIHLLCNHHVVVIVNPVNIPAAKRYTQNCETRTKCMLLLLLPIPLPPPPFSPVVTWIRLELKMPFDWLV